ncbi:unnamed protein product [Prunus armeniaca]|uniref:Uncharacterized protein n=1 Tax=Prunus armeniaca TaxID=36596 RepID=A0A6J5X6G2_PRUAR|nr:unnamed protein product [Prunus armeniaca]
MKLERVSKSIRFWSLNSDNNRKKAEVVTQINKKQREREREREGDLQFLLFQEKRRPKKVVGVKEMEKFGGSWREVL